MFLYLVLAIVALIVYFIFIKTGKKYISNVSKQYALITGCDSGFGRETAIRLDSLDFNVYATCLTDEGERSLRASCSEKLDVIRLDVTDSLQVQAAYDYVKKTMSSDEALWCVINNAGISTLAPIDWQDIDDMKRITDVNLWGLIDVTKTFLPLLKKSRGRLVNLSSLGGILAVPNAGSYCLSKFAVEAFSDSLRREMVPWGVKVVLIEPGYFVTDMTLSLGDKLSKTWNSLPEEKKIEYGEEFLRKTKLAAESDLKDYASPKKELVVDAVVDGVMSLKPKYRYVVGLWAPNLMWTTLALLPTWITDSFFTYTKGLEIPGALKIAKKYSKK